MDGTGVEERAQGDVLTGVSVDDGLVPAGFRRGHRHAAYQVGVLQGGVGHAFYRGAHTVLANEVIVFESDEPHAGRLTGPTGWLRRSFLDVTPEAFARIAGAVAGRAAPAPHFPAPGAPELLPTFARLFADLRRGLTTLERDERIVDALALLIERRSDAHPPRRSPRRPPAEPRAVREVRAYLEAHLAADVSLEQLGRVTGMNWDYLRKVFRRHVGVPPHRYQILLRLERAKALLLTGAPPAQAALAAGFADQAHLTRTFRRYLGVTPGALVGGLQNVQEDDGAPVYRR